MDPVDDQNDLHLVEPSVSCRRRQPVAPTKPLLRGIRKGLPALRGLLVRPARKVLPVTSVLPVLKVLLVQPVRQARLGLLALRALLVLKVPLDLQESLGTKSCRRSSEPQSTRLRHTSGLCSVHLERRPWAAGSRSELPSSHLIRPFKRLSRLRTEMVRS